MLSHLQYKSARQCKLLHLLFPISLPQLWLHSVQLSNSISLLCEVGESSRMDRHGVISFQRTILLLTSHRCLVKVTKTAIVMITFFPPTVHRENRLLHWLRHMDTCVFLFSPRLPWALIRRVMRSFWSPAAAGEPQHSGSDWTTPSFLLCVSLHQQALFSSTG